MHGHNADGLCLHEQNHTHKQSNTHPSNKVHPRQTLVRVVTAGTQLKPIGQEWQISNEKAYQQFLSESGPSGNNHARTDGENDVKIQENHLSLCCF